MPERPCPVDLIMGIAFTAKGRMLGSLCLPISTADVFGCDAKILVFWHQWFMK